MNNQEYYQDLSTVQNSYTSIDIMTITAFMKSQSEKIMHIVRYAEKTKLFDISNKYLNQLTKAEKLITFFSSIGFKCEENNKSKKYIAMKSPRKTGYYMFIGKKGALRHGKMASKSQSLSHCIDRIVDIERNYFHTMNGYQ